VASPPRLQSKGRKNLSDKKLFLFECGMFGGKEDIRVKKLWTKVVVAAVLLSGLVVAIATMAPCGGG